MNKCRYLIIKIIIIIIIIIINKLKVAKEFLNSKLKKYLHLHHSNESLKVVDSICQLFMGKTILQA